MTREEAVGVIERLPVMSYMKKNEKQTIITTALDMAIEALKEPEIVHCKDCKLHNSCSTEDVFNFVRLENGFCAVGKAKKN